MDSTGVVYALTVHSDVEQFARLVKRLSENGSRVVAHVDRKVDDAPFRAVEGATFTQRRVNVRWGGYSLAEAMLIAAEAALSADPHAHHVQWLSGQDYPARPEAELIRFLESRPETTFMNYYPMVPGSQFHSIAGSYGFLDQIAVLPPSWQAPARRLVRRANRRLPDRRPPVQLWRGSAWSCLARPDAQLILDRIRTDGALRRYFRTILVPDEILPQTILCNSGSAPALAGWRGGPGEYTGWVREHLHYIDWSTDRENPAVLTVDDLPRIRASGAFFIRKVARGTSDDLMDTLDAAVGS